VPRYFMHLADGIDVLIDPEGTEMAFEAVAAKALAAARDCMAGDVHKGVLDLRYRIDVHDENDKVVHSLPFANAVKILPPN